MLRVGIIGCGSIANVHAWVLDQLDEVKIVALSDVVEERAKGISDSLKKGAAKCYTNYMDMLETEELDCVHICTPHYLHKEMIVASLSKGVNVFSEKPPAITMEEFREIKAAAASYGKKVGFCFQNRFNKTTEALDDLIREGKLGNLLGAKGIVTWKREKDYYDSSWKGRLKTEGGGVLINQAIHSLDLLIKPFGEPVCVKATVSNHHLMNVIEVEDTVEAWIEFEEGKRACFYASNGYVTDAPVMLEYQFEQGRVLLIGNELSIYREDADPEHIIYNEEKGIGKGYWGNGHKKCIRRFYECLQSGESFENEPDGVEKTMKTMMEIYSNREPS